MVNEVNSAPILSPIANKTVAAGQLLTVNSVVNDPDLPAQILTFSLGAGAPTGANLDSSSGIFSWTPSNAQSPSTNVVTIQVADNGTPSLSDQKSITVSVNEVNQEPVLGPLSNRTVDEQTLLTFTASATDPDLPANALTFSLVGAPAGASIDVTTGVFRWTPTEGQGPKTQRAEPH